MVRNREKPPAPALRLIGGGRRVQIDLGSSSAPINKRPDNEKQGTVAVKCVDTIIGREYIALRTERYIYDPHISRYELWPYKTGPRKGQFRKVRVWGAYRDRRISVRRYRDASLAAYAYQATRRTLGIGLLPLRSCEASLTMMGCAQVTAAGANSTRGQELAARMKSLGVQIADEPFGEFWWADR